MNKVQIIGRLTKDVEIRYTNTQKAVVQFTVAVDRKLSKEKKAQAEQTADFINCVAWNGSAEFLNKYAKKGTKVGVVGHLATRSYDGKNGKVYVTEVITEEVEIADGWKTEDDGTGVENWAQVDESEIPF